MYRRTDCVRDLLLVHRRNINAHLGVRGSEVFREDSAPLGLYDHDPDAAR